MIYKIEIETDKTIEQIEQLLSSEHILSLKEVVLWVK